ncbi:MAG: hypothetical protein WDM89_07485 [Rhizomicrobium sp.]
MRLNSFLLSLLEECVGSFLGDDMLLHQKPDEVDGGVRARRFLSGTVLSGDNAASDDAGREHSRNRARTFLLHSSYAHNLVLYAGRLL